MTQDEVIALMERGCDLGSMEACSWAGSMLMADEGDMGDLSRSRALLDRACGGGFGPGCAVLGILVSRHDKDEGQAKAIWSRSFRMVLEQCEQGLGRGCDSLATHYERGRGTAVDLPLAVRANERAINLPGSGPWAHWSLGRLLRAGGAGLAQDRARGEVLALKACADGYGWACENLAEWATAEGRSFDQWTATALRNRACSLGTAKACMTLLESEPAPEVQFRLVRRACDFWSIKGCLETARRLREGLGTPASPADADALLAKVCATGGKDACR